MKPSERLAELNLTLPPVATPVGSYIPAQRSGLHVFTSGQLAIQGGEHLHKGKVTADVSIDEAAEAAGIAVLNAVAAAAHVAGGIDAIARVVRVAVFVASSAGFTDQARVANGASDLLAKIFGDQGRHARAAVGVAELPLGASVEVELMIEIAS